jgi:hypothetical protein
LHPSGASASHAEVAARIEFLSGSLAFSVELTVSITHDIGDAGMAFSVKILPRQHLDVILYASDVARSDFDEVWKVLLASKEWDFTYDDITVFAPDADLANLNFESVNEEARRFKNTLEDVQVERPRRTAIVVSNQVQVLGARMFLAYVASNPSPNAEFKLFNKVGTAIAWIEEGRTAAGSRQRIDQAEIERALAELERARREASGQGSEAKAS